MLEIVSKSRPWLLNLILINCVLEGRGGMRGKSILNENVIIIFSLNKSECRKLLRSASSRTGFSLDTGIEESACYSSCLPLLFAIHKRSSKDLFSLCFLLKRPLRRTPWDRRFLWTSSFNEQTLMLERTDDMFLCWYIWSLWSIGNGVCSRIIQLSLAENLSFSILSRFHWLFRKNLNLSYLNIFNGMIIFNEMTRIFSVF